jgi:hypothetical protein
MARGYDKARFEDCSYLLAYKIKKGLVQKVTPVEDIEPRCDDVTRREYWDPRVQFWSQYYQEEITRQFSRERLAQVGARLPAHYYDEMPGATLLQRMDEAEKRKLPYQDLMKMLRSNGQPS